VKLERTTFETSRAAEYFDARKLSTLTGVQASEFASVCLKELVDNALDACETAGVAPEIDVDVTDLEGVIELTVSDNGPGIPPELVERVLDYSVFVSDKAAYRSPTRGAQGNALKTIIGIPYSLGSHEPVIIEARGVRHVIEPGIDPAGEVRIDYTTGEIAEAEGTRTRLTITPGYDVPEDRVQDFDPLHWLRSFAAFNPHATFSYQGKSASSKEVEIYKSTHEGPFKKYVPSEPTSAHWYSPETLKKLVFSHIAHAMNGGRDLPLGEFVRQFQGLSSTAKAKAVTKHLPAFRHLSDFEGNEDAVGELLSAMQAASKPPKPKALGWVGEEHFRAFFEQIYHEVKEYKYVRRSSTLPSGLPFTFEFALATLDRPGHLYCGINYSPTFGDPLAGTTLVGKEFKADGIRSFLSQGHALPQSDYSWHYSPASVAVAAHIITPAPIYLDRGKTRLSMEGA
jgi:DNA topoisomerase VI subunit B